MSALSRRVPAAIFCQNNPTVAGSSGRVTLMFENEALPAVAPVVADIEPVAPFIPAFSKDDNFNSPAWTVAVGFGLSPETLRYAACCAERDTAVAQSRSATNETPATVFIEVLGRGW